MNLIGKKFSKLTVIDKSKKKYHWICECECGNIKDKQYKLTSFRTKSCGCLRKGNIKHSYSLSPTYKSWQSMKTRCLNSNNDNWKYYGGRGITICERWLESFENFLADMGERPKDTTLDRINSEGNYEPSNCKWSTIKEQINNRKYTVSDDIVRSIKILLSKGVSQKMLANHFNLSESTISNINRR